MQQLCGNSVVRHVTRCHQAVCMEANSHKACHLPQSSQLTGKKKSGAVCYTELQQKIKAILLIFPSSLLPSVT